MPKIIFTSNFLKDAPSEQLSNYVRYIGTREGVEKIDSGKALLPATVKQKQLIAQIIRDIATAKGMHEYNDYLLHPTRENASEFISIALENNLNLIGKRKNYVDYIANRPRVERINEHGLFTDDGAPVILSQVADEVAGHKDVIWTHVISLRREDAERLGYNNAAQWQSLLRSKRAMLAKYMRIDNANLKWYAAFHNESHHPHVHLMVYSKDEKEGFLTNNGIEAMRSELGHEIFRQDFMHIYDRQNDNRQLLKENAKSSMKELIRQLQSGVCESREIEEKILLLLQRLQNTKGKKVYGYLKADVKNIVDQIVDALQTDERVAKLYAAWNEAQNDILRTYTDKLPPPVPLSQQPAFKSIKNMVIAEALSIGSHHFLFEPDNSEEIFDEHIPAGDNDLPDIPDGNPYASVEELLTKSALQNNTMAAYKLGMLYLTGKLVEKNHSAAVKWLTRAAENGNHNAAYQLGKLCIESKDISAAIRWLTASASQNNPYAQYALGKLYLSGHEVEQDKDAAARWLSASAEQGNVYAQFLLDHIDSNYEPSVLLAASRLMRQLANIFRDDQLKNSRYQFARIDRKRMRQLHRKKMLQGHAADDLEPRQTL